MIQSADFSIRAWHHAVDFVVEPPPPDDPIAALKAAVAGVTRPGLLVPLVLTGIYAGPIHLTSEILDSQPDTVASGWEDIAEVSLVLPEGRAFFNESSGSDVHDVGSLSADDAGSYRARIHAAGRDADYDVVVDASTEHHLVQFWKAPPSPMAVLTLRSAAGKSLPAFLTMWLEGM